MFKHILVPTDGTEKSKSALDIAIKMQKKFNQEIKDSQITLLHVIQTLAEDLSEDFDKFYSALRKKAQKNLEETIQAYQEEQVIIKPEIILDKRVQGILDYADNNKVDLIILTSHRIDPENPTHGWGTISHKVGILAHCPVMLVK